MIYLYIRIDVNVNEKSVLKNVCQFGEILCKGSLMKILQFAYLIWMMHIISRFQWCIPWYI